MRLIAMWIWFIGWCLYGEYITQKLLYGVAWMLLALSLFIYIAE